jgi:hypothetical protein
MQQFYLKIGHETPETPECPPVVKSSALPLKSRITFPVLTSKILRTTLYKIKVRVRKEKQQQQQQPSLLFPSKLG